MDDKITIVTGFFDCNRGQHKNQARSNDKYFKYFEFWARIQNDVIIFGNKETVERALEIRKKFGREESTRTVIVEDLTLIEKDLYNKMREIEECGIFKNLRIRDYDISNEALYDYVMFLKFWMIKEAARLFPDSNTMAWIDLGFNHGGDCYTNPEDFDFLWKYKFDSNKIHLFLKKPVDKELGCMKMMLMTDSIMGSPFFSTVNLAGDLYEKIKDCMEALISLSTIDDDQMLMMMACKRWPELFELHYSDWFMPLKEYGGEHLTVRIKNKQKKTIKEFIKDKSLKQIFQYLYARFFMKTSLEKYLYIKRLKKEIIKYE